MERPLVLAAVFYLVGLVVGEAFTYFPLVVTCVLAVTSTIAAVFDRRRGRPLWILGLVAGLACFGMIRMQIATRILPEDDLARFATREPVQVMGMIDAPLAHGPDYTEVILKAYSITVDGQENSVRGRLRLTVRDNAPDLQYGDRVRVELRLRPPSGLQNPGGFDYAAYLRHEGIRAVAAIHHPEGIERIAPGGFAPLRRIYDWRERIRQVLDGSLSPNASSILQAMLIGETGSLSPEVREAFMISGTTHLLSISGSHLALVAWLVFNLSCRGLRRLPGSWMLIISRRMTVTRLSVLATLVPVLFYTVLAGSQVATVRSLIMILVYLAAVWLQRADDSLNALAIAVLVIVLWDPQAIFSISFQLSYVAVLAMVLVGGNRAAQQDIREGSMKETIRDMPWLRQWFEKVGKFFSITVVAGAATLPLTAYYFNQVSWVGFLSNLIAVPLVGMLIVPLGLVCAVGAILFQQTILPLAGLNDLLATSLLWIVESFARFPGAEIHVPSPPALVVIALYLAGLVALVYKGPAIRKGILIGVSLMVVIVWSARWMTYHPEGLLRVVFLDVGQGDAAWIQMPDGQTMLIDGGSAYGDFDLGRLVIAPYLWNTGQWRVDTLVASHPQLDHMGGLSYIARKFKIGEVWTNGMGKEAIFYDRFERVVSMKAIPEKRIVGDGLPLLQQGSFRIQSLHPDSSEDLSAVSDNNRSLVIRIQYGRDVVLFTGDIERLAERELLRWGNLLQATVLKVPHHGSRTSIDSDFLSLVAPPVAVISVGKNNSYRHPSPETLAAYASLGARIYRTDRDGAVLFETDGKSRMIRTYHDITPHPVPWRAGMTAAESLNFKKIFRRYWYGLV